MSLPWPESYWGSYTAVLAAETVGVLLFALVIQRRIATPRTRRAVWQGAFLATGLAILLPILSPQLKSWRTFPKEREISTVTPTIAIPVTKTVASTPETTQPIDSSPTHFSAVPFIPEPNGKFGLEQPLRNTPTPPVPKAAIAPKPAVEVAWLGVWALGILLLVSRIVLAQILAWRCASRPSWLRETHLRQTVEALCHQLHFHRSIALLTSRQLTSPVAFGGWRPAIVVPASFSQDFTREQQQAMLAHEIAHLAARDPHWNLLADMVCAALWWHPLVWHARRQLSLASEQAADEASLLVADGAQNLAECLVALGGRLSPARPASWLGVEGQFRSSLGQRVSHLINLSGQTWQPASRTALLFTKLLLPLLLTASALHSPAWTTPQALTEGDPMTAFKQTWRHTFATVTLAAAIHSSSAQAAEEIEAVPATTNAPAVNLENPSNQYRMSEKMLQRYGLTNGNQPKQHSMSDDMRRRYGLMPATANNTNANSETNALQSETEQPEPQPQAVGMSEAMRRRFKLDQVMVNQPRSASLSEVDRKLRETKFAKLEFPTPATLSKALKYLSDQAGDQGINFVISSSLANRAPEKDPVTGLPIALSNPGDIPLQLDTPLTEITLKNALDAITQLTAEPVYYTVNNFGVVFACGKMEMTDEASPPASPMSAAMMRRYGLNQQTMPATGANDDGPLAPRLRQVNLSEFQLKSGTSLKEATQQIGARLNAANSQLNLNLIAQTHGLAGAKIGSDISLRQVNGLDLLDIITKVSTLPVEYVLRNNLVLIMPNERTGPNPNNLPRFLQSRAFKLDKQRFDSRLETTFGISVPKEMEGQAKIRHAITELAKHLGVKIPDPTKEIYYNPETGMLLLRANPEGLDTMAAALQTLGGDAPRAF